MRAIAIVLLLAVAALAGVGAEPLIYTEIWADVPPEIRAGRVFAPASPVCKAFGAGVEWSQDTGIVSIRQADKPEIVLIIGSTTAIIGGQAVTLEAAPYVKQGRTMVPVRFLAESLGVPVTYHVATRTLRFPVGDRLHILPLPADRGGIVLEMPAPGITVSNPILLQGVGNTWEGNIQIELLVDGVSIADTFTTCAQGSFAPFSTRLSYTNPRGEIIDATIVFHEEGAADTDQPIRYTRKVRLLPTE